MGIRDEVYEWRAKRRKRWGLVLYCIGALLYMGYVWTRDCVVASTHYRVDPATSKGRDVEAWNPVASATCTAVVGAAWLPVVAVRASAWLMAEHPEVRWPKILAEKGSE